jgi:RimJ/RimL family protein N-acetyltransferase
VFHPAVHGQGYATEAADAVLRLAFEGVGAHRVVARLDTRNAASARLCTRLGMIHEATLRQADYIKDEWCDTAVYAMLAADWRALEDAPEVHRP